MSDLKQLMHWLSTATPEQIRAFEAEHPGLLARVKADLGGTADVDQRNAQEELEQMVADRYRLLFGDGGELIVNTLAITAHCLEFGLNMPDGARQYLVQYLRRRAGRKAEPASADLDTLIDTYRSARPAKRSGEPPRAQLLAIGACALEQDVDLPVDIKAALVRWLNIAMLAEDQDVKASTVFKNRADMYFWRRQQMAALIEEIQATRPGMDRVEAAHELLQQMEKTGYEQLHELIPDKYRIFPTPPSRMEDGAASLVRRFGRFEQELRQRQKQARHRQCLTRAKQIARQHRGVVDRAERHCAIRRQLQRE